MSDLAQPLLRWFDLHRRDLPWRREPRNPYHVWVSEVMLQQTQVATVIPYFQRWIERFPTLADLAAAPLQDVMKAWEGLGYYSRARNLHCAAQQVLREHGGRIPPNPEALRALPGVGSYIAGAIASLAFNQPVLALDSNSKRVLCRLFAHEKADRALRALAQAVLPTERAGAFNEALIELGALICTARQPRCVHCPLQADCAAFQRGTPTAYPRPRPKRTVSRVVVPSLVLTDGVGRALLCRRPAHGLLGGLWEFLSAEQSSSAQCADEDAAALAHRRAGLRVDPASVRPLGEVSHAFTHFKVTRRVWHARALNPDSLHLDGYAEARWASIEDARALPLTRSDQKILALWRADVQQSGLPL